MYRKPKNDRYGFFRVILALAFVIPWGIVASPAPPALAATGMPSPDGPGVWTSDGPYGGNIQDIAFSPGFAADRTVFVATTQGVFKSTNGGDSWIKASQGLSPAHVTALAIAPDSTLFAGTAGGGVFKSVDGGASWAATNTGMSDLDIHTLAVAPTYPLTPTLLAGTMESLYYSGNGGANWEFNEKIDAHYNPSEPTIHDIAFSPDYADDSTIWVGTTVGLRRSKRDAREWGGPSRRYGNSAIYDAANERMIVFGGKNASYNKLNDVWALDLRTPGAEAWRRLAPSGTPPVARYWHSAIYDAANERMVIFGGYGNEYLNDVWSLDLHTPGAETWTQLSPSGTPPVARYRHSAIYDAANERMIVFGGNGREVFNDVWALDLSTSGAEAWTQLSPSGTPPAKRYAHSAIYDAANKRMIVFGGDDAGYEQLNDVWALDLSTSGAEAWTQLSPSGTSPVKRSYHGAIYDAVNERMIVSGGSSWGYRNDAWTLDLRTPGAETWTLLGVSPFECYDHNVIYDVRNERMIVLVESENNRDYNDVWALDLRAPGAETWIPFNSLLGPQPARRYSYSAIYDAANERMIIFGGNNDDQERLDSVWALDLSMPGNETGVPFRPLGTAPPARSGHSAIYDAANERMIVFGGNDDDWDSFNDVWALDLSTPGAESWTQLSPSGTLPVARYWHSAIYDAPNERMIIFGRSDSGENSLNDVWALALDAPGSEAWVQLSPSGTPPAARNALSAIYDAANRRMLVFGGYDTHGNFYNDVWALDLSAPGSEIWTQLNPPEPFPPTRFWNSAIYDAANEQMLIFGGADYEVLNDVWALDLRTPGAETWTLLDPSGSSVPALSHHNAIYDAVNRRMVVFGGMDPDINALNELWALDLSTPGQSRWTVPNSVQSVALSPAYTGDGTVLIGTPNGILQSQDGGESWTPRNAGLPAGVTIQTLAFSPRYVDDHTVFAGATTGVYRSTNAGMTWTAANNGLEAIEVQALAVSPAYQDDPTLFAGTGSSLYRSPNAGQGWVVANVGLAAANVRRVAVSSDFAADHTVFAAGETGVYKSTADGVLWTGVNNGLTTPQVYDVAMSPGYTSDQTLFAATADGVFRSGDGGGGWTGFNNGLEAGNVNCLALSPQFVTDRSLFAIVGDDKSLQSSTDAGGSWSPPELRGLATNVIALSPGFAADRRAWAGTQSGWLTTADRHLWQGWPAAQSSYSAIYDAPNERMVVFDGAEADPKTNDIWALNLSAAKSVTWTLLSPLGAAPTMRSEHSAIYDAANERMIVFGGDGSGAFNDVWALDLRAPGAETWTQIHPSGAPPAERDDHSVIYDTTNARMIVFGGYDSNNDVWALNLSSPGAEIWTQLSPSGTLPPERWAHSAIYDAANEQMVIFGGYSNGADSNDVWALNLSTPGAEVWTQLGPSGTLPPKRGNHSAIYDTANAQMIIFGGSIDGDYSNDVWALNLSTPGAEVWTQLSPSGTLLPQRAGHSAIYDTANAQMIIFGGYSGSGLLNDVGGLRLQAPLSWTQHPTDTTIPGNQDYFSDRAVSLLAVSPNVATDHTLFLVSDDQLYHTADAGATWELRATLTGITDLILSPTYPADHTLYAVASGDVYQSSDEGVTWTALSAGLGANTVSIAHDGQSQTLFAATSSGVWRYTFPQPENVRTLVLTHQGRIHDRYGAAAADDLLKTLYALAEHPEVSGLVVDLGDANAYPDVATAYAAWDASSPSGTVLLGDTALANRVALAIRDVVGAYVDAYPNLHYLVLVGHDEIIPFHRLPDGTAADALPYANYAPVTGTVALALAEGLTLSDDPYASLHPLTLPDGRALYVPDLAAGRLVESPDDISAAIDAFLLRSEVNGHARAFVSGADYALMDGAFAIADTLRAGNLAAAELIGNDWTASDLALPLLAQDYDLISLNQHAYHDKLLAPDNTTITPQDVLNATADLQQTLVYATGCHAGLSLPDAPNHGLASNGGLDFPQAFAQRGAPLLANTGYGWATRYTVGLTERLALYFSQALAHSPGSTVSIGQALRDAKRRYYLAAWRFDAYDAKVLNEMTLYGLPMYSLSTPVLPAHAADAPARPTTHVTITFTTADTPMLTQPANPAVHITYNPPDAGRLVASLPPSVTQAGIQFQFPAENYDVSEVGEARYYSYLGEVQANRGMPLLPRFSFGVSIPGARTQGVLFASGTYSDVFALPMMTTAVISESLGENQVSDYVPGQWYPTVLQLVNQLADGGDDQLTMSLGNMRRGVGPGGEELTPTQRLYNNVVFEVYYYNRPAEGVPDRTPPVVTEVLTDIVDDSVRVSVAANDVPGAGDAQSLGVWRVVAAYTSNAPGVGQWESRELAYNPATQRWEGSIRPAPQGENPMLLIVQAVDRGGNVAADDNDGWYYQIPAMSSGSHHIYLPLVMKPSN